MIAHKFLLTDVPIVHVHLVLKILQILIQQLLIQQLLQVRLIILLILLLALMRAPLIRGLVNTHFQFIGPIRFLLI